MLKRWFKAIESELNNIVKGVESFNYGNIIGLFIQFTGLVFILGGILYFFEGERVTYFAKIGTIYVGILLSVIGKVFLLIMKKEENSKITKILANIMDAVLWASIISAFCFYFFEKVWNLKESVLLLSGVALFISILLLTTLLSFIFQKKKLGEKVLVYYIFFVAIPFTVIFIFIKKEYRFFVMVISVSAILLLTMILLSFQLGEILAILNPFKSFNTYYPIMVISLVISGKIVNYVIPKTSLVVNFERQENLAKIFMTWGMIVTMAALYMFDWEVLMKGAIGWDNNDKNVVLWAFTTYELISQMLDKQYSLFRKK